MMVVHAEPDQCWGFEPRGGQVLPNDDSVRGADREHRDAHALLRRLGEHTSAQWRCGAILLDTRQARVLVDGLPLQLTSHEFKLLSLLMQRKGEVLSRTELSEHIYPHDSDRDSNTIEVFVGRLRKKLPAGSIETVRGLGYRLIDAGHAA